MHPASLPIVDPSHVRTLGDADGALLGLLVGNRVGPAVGLNVGALLGDTGGLCVGALVGLAVGEDDGCVLGDAVGGCVGLEIGEFSGLDVGVLLGLVVGDFVGVSVPDVGCFVGCGLGLEVGTCHVVGSKDIVGLPFLDDLGLLTDLDRRFDGLWLAVGDGDIVGFACFGALELLDP